MPDSVGPSRETPSHNYQLGAEKAPDTNRTFLSKLFFKSVPTSEPPSPNNIDGEVSPVDTASYSIGVGSEKAAPFVGAAAQVFQSAYLESLDQSDQDSFVYLPPPKQEKAVFDWLTSPDRMQANENPRLEFRQCFSGGKIAANIALYCSSGEERSRIYEEFKDSPISEGLQLTKTESTTIEISAKNVNKSTPIGYLRSGENFERLLGQMDYKPGPLIDAKTSKSVIFSDADGTIWDKPVQGKSVESTNLLNSPARDSILSYLSSGGVLVLNTGNDPARTVRRFLVGLAGIPEKMQQEILSRIVFASAGGGSLAACIDGKIQEIEDYHHFDPTERGNPKKLDMLYLGDDAKHRGNDMPAFEVSGDHFICVAPEEAKSDVEASEITHRIQYGEVKSVHSIFSSIVIQARTNKAALGEGKSAPLFQDMDALLANTKNIAPAAEIIKDTITCLGSREAVNQKIQEIADFNQAQVVDQEFIVAAEGALPPPSDPAPQFAPKYQEILGRMEAFSEKVETPIATPLQAMPPSEISRETNAALAQVQAFLDQTDFVDKSKAGSVNLRILEPGNNDQSTPIFLAHQIKQLREEVGRRGGNPDNLNIQVLVLGKGGHATTALFPQIGQLQDRKFTGTEEAVSLGGSLQRALSESGIPSEIVTDFGSPTEKGTIGIKLEKESEHTGHNVQNSVASYNELKPDFQWCVTGIVQSLRQTLTFAQQYQAEGKKCYDKIWSMPLPRSAQFVKHSLSDHQAMMEFYGGMAENARLIHYAMKNGPFIPPSSSDFKEFKQLVDTTYEMYAELNNMPLEEAKEKVDTGELLKFFGDRFSALEQSVPWNKAPEHQEAYTKSAMQTLKKQSDASQVKQALATLGDFAKRHVSDEDQIESLDMLHAYISGSKRQGQSFLQLCQRVNQAFSNHV